MVKRGKDSGLPVVRFSNGEGVPATGAFIALVDGRLAPLLPLDLPEGLKGQARERVAMRQVSDAIGVAPGAAELRPFAIKGGPAVWQRAIVSAADQVRDWRDLVQGAGGRCAAILPDYLALPVTDGVWTLHFEKDRVTARLGLADGFTAAPALAQVLLEKAAAEALPEAVFCLGTPEDRLNDWLLGLDLPVFTDIDAVVDKGFAPPQVFANGELGFDLARDPRAAFETLSQTLKAWRLPLVLAVLGLGFWSASMMLQTRQLDAEARAIRARTVADVRSHFVPTGPVLDIRAQVSQVLAARQAQSAQVGADLAPLDLLKSAAGVIVDHPGRLVSSSFQPQGGVTVDVLMPDFAALDQLVAALEKGGAPDANKGAGQMTEQMTGQTAGQAGLAVTVLNAGTAEDGGVAAALALAPKGPAKKGGN